MRIAGGIIGLIAGIIAFFAAIITLFVGGLGSAFEAEGGETVIALGWGGILFAFLVIIFSAVALGVKRKWVGVVLAICSILGAVLGGTLVAVLMVLSLIGGILVFFGSKGGKNPDSVSGAAEVPDQIDKGSPVGKIAIYSGSVLGGLFVLAIVVSLVAPSDGTDRTDSAAETRSEAPAEANELHYTEDAAYIGDFLVQIDEFRTTSRVGERLFQREAGTGEVFVLITISYRNESSAPVPSFRQPSIRLIDGSGNAYSSDMGASAAYATEAEFDANILSDLNPGIRRATGDAFVVSEQFFDRETWKVEIRSNRQFARFSLSQRASQNQSNALNVDVPSEVTPSGTSVETPVEAAVETPVVGASEASAADKRLNYGYFEVSDEGWCCGSVIGVEEWDVLNVRLAPDADSNIIGGFEPDQRELIVFECRGQRDRQEFFNAWENRNERIANTWCLVGENSAAEEQTNMGWVNAYYIRAISP